MYSVYIQPRARKQLDKLGTDDFNRLTTEIKKLGNDPRKHGSIRLRAKSLGDFRLRVGNWRVRYDIFEDTKKVHILDISRRDKAYRV